ncbi:MAG: EAL domain-containing protein [Solirubrobacterales bacterium]|nr:EAL domain-containing protein [Solirubrobacterales bacterium]
MLATVVSIAWLLSRADSDAVEYANRPFTFFLLGIISGHYARGALGDYDFKRALEARRIRQALADGAIVAHFQPIVATAGGALIGVEALARWQREGGTALPAEFIPAAESDPRTIRLLTLEMLGQAAGAAADWPGAPLVAVNISPRQLRLDLAEEFAAAVEASPLPAGRLVVEVTESAIAGGEADVIEALAAIRSAGPLIAIDDFGVGHSSLGRLDQIPVDIIKIDRQLVQRVEDDGAAAIVGAIVEMAQGLGIRTVAEGVETEATRKRLEAIGCEAMQGHLASPPLPAAEAAAWLQGSASWGEALKAKR